GGGNTPPRDGLPAVSAQIGPDGIAVSAQGEVLFSSVNGQKVWRIDDMGLLHTVAGTGVAGTAGEGGPAANAQLSYPLGLAVDAIGAVYIMDSLRIARVGRDGRLTSLQAFFPPFSATAITVDPAGNVYFTRPLLFGNRILQLATDGNVRTFGGTG